MEDYLLQNQTPFQWHIQYIQYILIIKQCFNYMLFTHIYFNTYNSSIGFTTNFMIVNFIIQLYFVIFYCFGQIEFQFLCTRKTLLVYMSQFKLMKISTLIALQVLLEILLLKFYVVTVDVKKMHSNSYCHPYTIIKVYISTI